MALKNLQPVLPDYATEIELWVVEQELIARLTQIQTSLTPIEPPAHPIPIQLSPISRLPNELLIAIFTHGLQVEENIPSSASSRPFQRVLASVCQAWRSVVLQTPELWTKVFVTSSTPLDHLQTYIERSQGFKLDVHICHWPAPKRVNEVNSAEVFLDSVILGTLRRNAHRLRSLALWDVSDSAVCSVMSGLVGVYAPNLEDLSVTAGPGAHTLYYQHRNPYLVPFLDGGAPRLTNLEIDHFPIETFRMRSGWRFHSLGALTSLTLRTRECPTTGFDLPPYLIEFPALCELLRSTPHLTYLALSGPVVEPDEDFPFRPPPAHLPNLKTLIVHRREPAVRYFCELLSVLIAPNVVHLELPWHDDMTVEMPNEDRTVFLFDGEGKPSFAGVKTLYLHDSVVKGNLATRSYMKAFPGVENLTLGGGDIAKFAATLRGFVVPDLELGSADGVLASGAWPTIRKVTLKDVDLGCWKGCVRGFCKWLGAKGHGVERVTVAVEVPRSCDLGSGDGRTGRAEFMRGLERLGKYASVLYVGGCEN